MAESDITFNNKAVIRVQAQIFDGRTLVGSCVAGPGETAILPTGLERVDIYLKNGITGWLIAHKLNSAARSYTLSQQNGRYILT